MKNEKKKTKMKNGEKTKNDNEKRKTIKNWKSKMTNIKWNKKNWKRKMNI